MSLKYQPVSAIPDQHGRIPPTPGMTLRQHYAGLAMQALASSVDKDGCWMSDPTTTAKYAVEFADALLLELAK